jgi:hypothetical protein
VGTWLCDGLWHRVAGPKNERWIGGFGFWALLGGAQGLHHRRWRPLDAVPAVWLGASHIAIGPLHSIFAVVVSVQLCGSFAVG